MKETNMTSETAQKLLESHINVPAVRASEVCNLVKPVGHFFFVNLRCILSLFSFDGKGKLYTALKFHCGTLQKYSILKYNKYIAKKDIN